MKLTTAQLMAQNFDLVQTSVAQGKRDTTVMQKAEAAMFAANHNVNLTLCMTGKHAEQLQKSAFAVRAACEEVLALLDKEAGGEHKPR